MATKYWIGGGNNLANDPAAWSPAGVPQPGDTLSGGNATAATAYTINVQGNDLAGDTLNVGYTGSDTVNLSHNAVAGISVAWGGAVINAVKSTATVWISHATATVNLAAGSDLILNPGYGSATVNVTGRATMTSDIGASSLGQATVNIKPYVCLAGSFQGGIAMHGGATAWFANDGGSTVEPWSLTTLDVAVLGTGSFAVASQAQMTFMHAVGGYQSVIDDGTVIAADPANFHALVTLDSAKAALDLTSLPALANADSWSYQNDLVRLYSGATVIDTVRVIDATPNGFGLQKVAGGIDLVALASAGQTLAGALGLHG